jgi:hypothetical protein
MLTIKYDTQFNKELTELFDTNIDKNIRWSRNSCQYLMNDTFNNVINKNMFIKDDDNWDVYFPCTYDDIKTEINMMSIIDNKKYFILENCDEIVAKDLLWKHVLNFYGNTKTEKLMPKSYLLYNDDDLKKFSNDYTFSKIYIMKKNIQRQEGLKITKDKNEILNGAVNGYVIVQELLQNPYIISGRKTNMRFYILVVCKNNKMNVFVYNDGFMYYSKELFKKNSTDIGPNITTGYIDRQVYLDNPLTHQDLKQYLDNPLRQNLSNIEKYIINNNKKISDVYFNNIYNLIKDIFIGLEQTLTKLNKFNNTNITFQLFGADIAVDDQLNPTIMEINKGPDLGGKDTRDSLLKYNVVYNMFKILDIIKIKPNTSDDSMYIKII